MEVAIFRLTKAVKLYKVRGNGQVNNYVQKIYAPSTDQEILTGHGRHYTQSIKCKSGSDLDKLLDNLHILHVQIISVIGIFGKLNQPKGAKVVNKAHELDGRENQSPPFNY